jgi:hypothetical protein
MQGIKYKLNMREVIPKGIANPCITATEPQKQTSLFLSLLRTWSDMFKEEKVENQKIHQVPVPTHLRSMNFNTCTRRYGKNIERCAV